MISIEYAQPQGDSILLGLTIPSSGTTWRLCSDPLSWDGSRVSSLDVKRRPLVDVDVFEGETGSGEHPCYHVHADGVMVVDTASLLADQFSHEKWSPVDTTSACHFPEHTGLRRGTHWVLSSISGAPTEHYIGLSIRNYGWHEWVQGSITPEAIHIEWRFGVLDHGSSYYTPRWGEYDLKPTGRYRSGQMEFAGRWRRGSFPVQTLPQNFTTAPVTVTSDVAHTVWADILQGPDCSGLEGAWAQIVRNGVEAMVALEVCKGFDIADSLSVTGDAVDAISGVKALDSNSIENASQATSILDIIPPWRPFVTAALSGGDPEAWLKAGAEGYLWYTYVAKTTVADLREYVAAGKENCLRSLQQLRSGSFRSSSSGREGEWNWRTAAKVTLHPYARDGVEKALNFLDNIGLLPSLSRAWDLVPYSFVADWVCNAADVLAAIDTAAFSYRYQIDSVVTSKKVWRTGLFRGQCSFGDIQITCQGIDIAIYDRGVSWTIPLDPNLDLRGVATTGHVLAGSSLLVGTLS